MNPSIKKLADIAGRKTRRIIGLMSGTSLDGLDIALCSISGSGEKTNVVLNEFVTKPYTRKVVERLRKITSVDEVLLQEVCYQHTWLAALHADLILEALQEWKISPGEIDCVASHGQTIFHLPSRDQSEVSEKLNSTLQIADGDQISARTGILTISDFRQKHTAYGGEGAPMAALADRLLFESESEPRILLNIGGIANFTWLPTKGSGFHSFTTDTGPGNTLIDNVVQANFQKPFDEDGKIAFSGAIHTQLLEILMADEWFDGEEAKSTGPEYFNAEWIRRKAAQAGLDLSGIKPADLVATVTEFSAVTIAENLVKNAEELHRSVIYISGGGAHNPALTSRLKKLLKKVRVKNFSKLGFDPDAKEAVIFAILANEMLAGEGFVFDAGEDSFRKINFGKISFPV